MPFKKGHAPLPGGGRPKGTKDPHTRDKDAQRALYAQGVFAAQAAIQRAQIQSAIGLVHVFLRDKEGKWTRCEDPEQIETALNSGDPNCYMLSTKDPNVAAAKDLFDRALDKPTEHVDMQVSGGLDLRKARLAAGRARKDDA